MKAVFIEAFPFAFLDILDMRLTKGVNRHGNAFIKGVISDELEDEYVKMSLADTPVVIKAMDLDNNQCTLFCGLLEDMNIKSVNALKIMEIRVVSYSRVLDMRQNVIVFQNPMLTFDELVTDVLSPYVDASAIMNCGDGCAIGQMFVQYQETDWEFLIRMASMFNDVIVPNDTIQGVNIYFGFPQKPMVNDEPINPISYEVKKYVGGYLYKKENNVTDVCENDSVYYIVKDREIREVGEAVLFLDRQLRIAAVESRLEGQELVHEYTLMTLAGTKVPQARNFRIIGASLSGSIGQVAGSHVKTKLQVAHSNDMETAKWHPFSTVYSSPDGTGWYAMPEIGDTMRLYFPTEIEDDGYAISAVHLNTSPKPAQSAPRGAAAKEQVEEKRSDPNNVVFENGDGVKIMMSPHAILLSCSGSGGASRIWLQDGIGVTIFSELDIHIRSNKDVNIVSEEGETKIIGKESVSVSQTDAEILLADNNITFKGVNVITE